MCGIYVCMYVCLYDKKKLYIRIRIYYQSGSFASFEFIQISEF